MIGNCIKTQHLVLKTEHIYIVFAVVFYFAKA